MEEVGVGGEIREKSNKRDRKRDGDEEGVLRREKAGGKRFIRLS